MIDGTKFPLEWIVFKLEHQGFTPDRYPWDMLWSFGLFAENVLIASGLESMLELSKCFDRIYEVVKNPIHE